MIELIKFLCTTCNINFAHETTPEIEYLVCPICQVKKTRLIEKQLEEVTKQRDLLLSAIDLKKTIIKQ